MNENELMDFIKQGKTWDEIIRIKVATETTPQESNIPELYKIYQTERGKTFLPRAKEFLVEYIRKMKENKEMNLSNIKNTIEAEQLLKQLEAIK